MKVFLNENVVDAARRRIAWLFDEFDVVVASMSGGKDSTVVFHLCIEEAKRRGIERLPVLWLDQEAEWQGVVDYMEEIMYRPDVDPMWLQVPFRIFNATSHEDSWLTAWEEGREWMRPKDPISIQENTFKTDRFTKVLDAAIKARYEGAKTCVVAGMRAEESPTRYSALTGQVTYKGETWGKKHQCKDHYNMYPIYDWSFSDVWKFIHDEGCPYASVYDYQYQYGMALKDMRVSNLHHESAFQQLFYLQECEPETWVKLTQRLSGIDTAAKVQGDGYKPPKELPYMFADWAEYRDYLVDNLVSDEDTRDIFRKQFAKMDDRYDGINDSGHTQLMKVMIESVLVNDYHFTKLTNAVRRPAFVAFEYCKSGREKNTLEQLREKKMAVYIEGTKYAEMLG